MKSHLVTKRHLTTQGREDRKETMKDDSRLKIDGKRLHLKKSDIKLFEKLEESVDALNHALRKSGKIPDLERERFLTDMVEGYLSIMLVLRGVLTSSLDVRYHSARRVVNVSRAVGDALLDMFIAAGVAAKSQPWLAWEIVSAYNRLGLHHNKVMKRLNNAIISSLREEIGNLEEDRRKVSDLGDYLIEIAMPSLQIEDNICILLDEADVLALEEYQISRLHHLLKRTKTLLEWKRLQS